MGQTYYLPNWTDGYLGEGGKGGYSSSSGKLGRREGLFIYK